MSDPKLSKEEVAARLSRLVESRLTDRVLDILSEKGNVDWLESMIESSFKRVEKKPLLAETGVRA